MKNKREAITISVCMLVLFAFNIRNIQELTLLAILYDEFGYWTSAAYWNGMNWSGVTSVLSPYYSYGYGLLLALIIFMTPDMGTAYQTAIVMNSIMICLSFALSCQVFVQMLPKADKIKLIIFCFISCFYPSVIHHSQFAWSETIVMFVFWLCIFLLCKFLLTEKFIYIFLFTVSSMYIYILHQRNIAVLVSAVFIISAMTLKQIITKGQLLLLILTALFIFVGHSFVKGHIKENLWNEHNVNTQNLLQEQSLPGEKGEDSDTAVDINDFGGQLWKFKFLFSAEGIKCFIMGLLGKIYYMGLASFFLVYEGIYYLVSRFQRHRLKSYLYIYILLALAGTTVVSALFMIYPTRIDTVAYGRYTDCLLGIFIIYGLVHLTASKGGFKRLCYYSFFILLYQIFFVELIEQYQLWLHYATCSPVGNIFREFLECDVLWVSFMVMVLILLAFGFHLLIGSRRGKKIGLALLPIIWIYLTSSAVTMDIQLNKSDEVKTIVEAVIAHNDKNNIYYVYGENEKMDLYAGSIQFLAENIKIRCVDANQIGRMRSNSLIIMPLERKSDINMEQTEMVSLQQTAGYECFTVR